MKLIDVRASIYFDYESNEKDPEFEVGDHVKISTYKNMFGKGFTPNWSEEFCDSKGLKYCNIDKRL